MAVILCWRRWLPSQFTRYRASFVADGQHCWSKSSLKMSCSLVFTLVPCSSGLIPSEPRFMTYLCCNSKPDLMATWRLVTETGVYGPPRHGGRHLFFLCIISKQNLGGWELVLWTWVHLLPRIASFLDKVVIPSNNTCLSVLDSFLTNFYWSAADLQCCVSFRRTAKLLSYTYIYTIFSILFLYRLL